MVSPVSDARPLLTLTTTGAAERRSRGRNACVTRAVYTAEPGSDAAERLALLTVLGTQSLTG